MFKKCSCEKNCFDKNILGELDFLHNPTIFPITKEATKSYCGIFLSVTMVLILITLTLREYLLINKKYTVSYSEEFISRLDWSKKMLQ